uniref:Uncharacterized protein n=1 Tax=Lepeophtheirus salmonis TaxID=72036 RepID=A0A0K2U010_LEPSM
MPTNKLQILQSPNFKIEKYGTKLIYQLNLLCFLNVYCSCKVIVHKPILISQIHYVLFVYNLIFL